jgi:hypothetical protein
MNTKTMQDTDQVDGDQIEEDESGEFEIEIVDDVAEDDKPRRAEPAKEEDIPDEGDLEGYSEAVQKRIKKLTFEAKEAARQQAAAARERDEATNYAKSIYEQNKKLQEQLTQGQGAVVEQAKGRVESELNSAKAAYRSAYELGDADKIVDAQSKMIELQGRLSQLQNYRPAPRAQEEPAPQPKPQPTVKLDERQTEWMNNNKWYGNNSEMTGFALGVHERLVRNGVDPNSKTYYTEIDSAVRKRFADEFSDGAGEEVTPTPRKAANVVAPAGRSAPSPRRIKLTSTQAALAKRLGLKPEQYAAQLMKDAKNG